MFRDQNESLTRRLGGNAGESSSSASASITRQPSPDKNTIARGFFFDQFVTPGHLSFMDGIEPDDFLMQPILACSLAVISNRRGDTDGRELARQHYIAAIGSINVALRHPRRVKEDNTLIAVFLLGVFERITWDGPESKNSMFSHTHGLSMVLQLRGRSQIRTRLGSALFRDLRTDIVSIPTPRAAFNADLSSRSSAPSAKRPAYQATSSNGPKPSNTTPYELQPTN